MHRLASSDSDFWTTIDLMIERKWRQRQDAEDVDEELRLKHLIMKNSKKLKLLRKKTRSNSDAVEAIVKKAARDAQEPEYVSRMQRLHEELRKYAEEALQKRITDRQTNEMERLKKLILNGKTPLKDCPPELHEHPVFVFWRVIDKEVEKLSRAKADAYYRKLRRPRRKGKMSPHEPFLTLEDSCISNEEALIQSEMEANDQTDQSSDQKYENGIRKSTVDGEKFVPQEFAAYKYEDESIKILRGLMTVEELYRMADQIIGIPRIQTDTDR